MYIDDIDGNITAVVVTDGDDASATDTNFTATVVTVNGVDASSTATDAIATDDTDVVVADIILDTDKSSTAGGSYAFSLLQVVLDRNIQSKNLKNQK